MGAQHHDLALPGTAGDLGHDVHSRGRVVMEARLHLQLDLDRDLLFGEAAQPVVLLRRQ
jgi:hypothetical protein